MATAVCLQSITTPVSYTFFHSLGECINFTIRQLSSRLNVLKPSECQERQLANTLVLQLFLKNVSLFEGFLRDMSVENICKSGSWIRNALL